MVIEVTDRLWVFKQAGGCIEIGQKDDGSKYPETGDDLIHICEATDVRLVIDALTQALEDGNGTETTSLVPR